MKLDDEANDIVKKMGECHATILRLEKDIRGSKD